MSFAAPYSFLTVLTVAGLAACNDMVYHCDCAVPGVHGVNVTPQNATMNVGDKLQFGASVNADSGFA